MTAYFSFELTNFADGSLNLKDNCGPLFANSGTRNHFNFHLN
jgi:hypothetical protein